MAEAVILIGLQGAGKTTYYNKHLAQTHVHVSRDSLRSAEREAALIRSSILEERSFAVDNTNATRAQRFPYIQAAKAAGFSVRAVYLSTPVRTAIGRNNHRNDKKAIPVPAILRVAKLLQPPTTDEGFDLIEEVVPQPTDDERNPKLF